MDYLSTLPLALFRHIFSFLTPCLEFWSLPLKDPIPSHSQLCSPLSPPPPLTQQAEQHRLYSYVKYIQKGWPLLNHLFCLHLPANKASHYLSRYISQRSALNPYGLDMSDAMYEFNSYRTYFASMSNLRILKVVNPLDLLVFTHLTSIDIYITDTRMEIWLPPLAQNIKIKVKEYIGPLLHAPSHPIFIPASCRTLELCRTTFYHIVLNKELCKLKLSATNLLDMHHLIFLSTLCLEDMWPSFHPNLFPTQLEIVELKSPSPTFGLFLRMNQPFCNSLHQLPNLKMLLVDSPLSDYDFLATMQLDIAYMNPHPQSTFPSLSHTKILMTDPNITFPYYSYSF